MKSILLGTFALIALAVFSSPANAAQSGGIVKCRYYTPGVLNVWGNDDGCPEEGGNGIFQRPDFYDYARQDNQPWVSPHPTTTDVPGWDYPLGPDKTLTPQDPIAYNWTGTSCHTHTPGQTSPAGQWLGSYGVECTGVSAINLDFENFDFRLHGGTYLYVNANVTGNVKVKNTYFSLGPDISTNQFGWAFKISGSQQLVDLEDDLFDGMWPAQNCGGKTNCGGILFDDVRADGLGITGVGTTDKYNVWLNSPNRPISGGASSGTATGSFISMYDYVEGMTQGQLNSAVGNHGEFKLYTWNGPGIALEDLEYITVLLPLNASPTITAPFFTVGSSPASFNSSATEVIVANNFVVTNKCAGGLNNTCAGESLVDVGFTHIGTLGITDNWSSASGALACTISENLARPMSASISGNVLTVNSISGQIVFPGMQVMGVGVTPAIIQPYGTNSTTGTGGGAGTTYYLSGSSQNVATTTLIGLYTGIDTFVNTPANHNLKDGTVMNIPNGGSQVQGGTTGNLQDPASCVH